MNPLSEPNDGLSSATGKAAGRVLMINKDAVASARLEASLAEQNCTLEYAAGSADALKHLRNRAYDVVITDPTTSIDEDLALLSEMRAIRPGTRVILLAPSSTPEEVIAALRAKVFLCKSAPFDPEEIAEYAARAAAARDAHWGIEVLSAHRDWLSVRADCRVLTAERLMSFVNELQTELPPSPREDLMTALREVLMNAIEHGARFATDKVLEMTAIHTARARVLYVHDPGAGFRWERIPHSALSNPQGEPGKHLEVREQQGMRAGGFGILVARGVVDELLYSEIGNEVLLIKYLA